MRHTKKVLTAPWASPVASMATCARRCGPGSFMRRTTSLQGSSDRCLVQSAQEAVQRRVVGNGTKPESAAQFAVSGQSHFGFPIGPVLVAHEAQDGKQLRLRELVFAKASAIARHGGSGYSNATCAKRTKPPRSWPVASFAGADCSITRFRYGRCELGLRMSTEPLRLITRTYFTPRIFSGVQIS